MVFEDSLKLSGMNIWTLGSNLHRFSGREAVKKGPKSSKHFEIKFFWVVFCAFSGREAVEIPSVWDETLSN